MLVHVVIIEVLVLENKGLTYHVKGSIIEVLGLEGRLINDCKTWVVPPNYVLFD